MRPKLTTVLLLFTIVLAPGAGYPGPSIPGFYGNTSAAPPAAKALPQLKSIGQGVGDIVKDAAKNSLLIRQNQAQATINWNSFDIGANASVRFDQQGNKDWAALNRIYDRNPTQIYGQLAADGQVVLINQNGIVFGPGSQVNVHSLCASSLNISDEDFLKKTWKFRYEDYLDGSSNPQADSTVANHGTITTDSLGSVFLLAPTVENNGCISTTAGQIGLAAGKFIEIAAGTGGNRSALSVNVTGTPGDVTNMEAGQLLANTGTIGMYGKNLSQNGLIRSITAIKNAGKIELHASDKVVTGAGSVTACPITDSDEKVNVSFPFTGGDLQIRGLDPDNPSSPTLPAKRIEHHGLLQVPSGTVTLNAEERVYLASGSKIDVSGSWIEKPAASQLKTAQLNSNELRDSYGQKNGILKGATIQFNALSGSAIGDLSGSLAADEQTAMERSLAGGTIGINVTNGDIILREAATIDFSGGGVRYAAGTLGTTKLVSGNKIYDLSNASEWIRYDSILNDQTFVHERFGITDHYSGVYHGGAYGLRDLSSSILQGANAGSLILAAGYIRLDGELDGSVTRGFYQTLSEERLNTSGNQATLGLQEPTGGILVLGRQVSSSDPANNDALLTAVRLEADLPPLPAGFTAEDPVSGPAGSQTTILSAKRLNQAGLGILQIYANTAFSTSAEAALSLDAGASFSATARRIEHHGAIKIPSGQIELTALGNVTSLQQLSEQSNNRYVPLQERIVVADGSLLTTAGEIVGASVTGQGIDHPAGSGHLSGGKVILKDRTGGSDGVVMMRQAVIDVGGGYRLDSGGKVTGGNSGSLTVQGSSIALEGDLKAHSLVGNEGGSITLHANDISVSPTASALPADFSVESSLPEAFVGKLTLAGARLDQSGFSQIELRSVNDITFDSGVRFAPSASKLSAPRSQASVSYGIIHNLSGQPGDKTASGSAPSMAVAPEWLADTSVKTVAGVLFDGIPPGPEANTNAAVTISPDAQISVAPGGFIQMTGPRVDFAGLINAPAGTVELKATGFDLTVRGGGEIHAGGFNKRDAAAVMKGVEVGVTPLAGGSVKLEANRNLLLERGALIDVAGSSPVITRVRSVDGTPTFLTVAGDAGSVALTATEQLTVNGELDGHVAMEGLKGGSLSLAKKSIEDGLAVAASEIDHYVEQGFEALVFQSYKTLLLSGTMEREPDRSLTLDAPVIQGAGDERVYLQAPWLTLQNTYSVAQGSSRSGPAGITLAADWLDVIGSVQFSDFAEVTLQAGRDIRLADRYYSLGTPLWKGRLETAGNLMLQADRIYPTTMSDFTVHADGKITTLPGAGSVSGPINAAGGSLTVEARGIEHRGVLVSPMGSLVLRGLGTDSRLYLAEGSVTSVAGEAAAHFGEVEELFWTATNKNTTVVSKVEGAPLKSIELNSAEIIVKDGAEINVSGGSSIYGFNFVKGIEGSTNPLAGCHVILPDYPLALPGDTVYLSGIEGLSAGFYTLLPEEYAFLPGALVVTRLGAKIAAGQQYLTKEGYAVVSGYATYAGSSGRDSRLYQAYSVRPAADVLQEGNFNYREFIAGDAGSLGITASTAVIDGIIKAEAMNGFQGGTIAVSGNRITVGAASTLLPADFAFDSAVSRGLQGTLLVAAPTLSKTGFREMTIGDATNTDTILVEQGSVLEAERITLAASNAITLGVRAQLNGVSPSEGEVTLSVPTGKLNIESGAAVHASDAVTLEAEQTDLSGTIRVDHGHLKLTGANIIFSREETAPTQAGSYLTQKLWNAFSSLDDVRLQSRSDFVFLGDFDLSTQNRLTLDAGRIAGFDPSGGRARVSIGASSLNLVNTGNASVATALGDTGLIALSAEQINIGQGDLLFDGFGKVAFTAQNDLTVRGTGSLATGGSLDLTAARIAASSYRDEAGSYVPTDFKILAEAGIVSLARSGGISDGSPASGGALEIAAKSIEHAGLIDVGPGEVRLSALGAGEDDGVFLKNGSQILAQGNNYFTGGSVTLRADLGRISIDQGAAIDVSAGAQGDAGLISLISPTKAFVVNGALKGFGTNGKGGSFTGDAGTLDNFSSLNRFLAAGGFDGVLEMRARNGEVTVAADDEVRAERFKLVADDGGINVLGKVDASDQTEGGSVEFYAYDDLDLLPSSQILARATGPDGSGGNAFLSSTHGSVKSSGKIDVSGRGTGKGGSVGFRAAIAGDDVKVNLGGHITGAAKTTVEAVARSTNTDDLNIDSTRIAGWQKDLQTFLLKADAIEQRLLAGVDLASGQFTLIPGLEVQSNRDINLNAAWDLNDWRNAGLNPGAITLRAARDLNINANLVDHPTSVSNLTSTTAADSWALRLVAGSDLNSADLTATQAGIGNLTLASGKMVHTEKAPLQFASGADTLIGSGGTAAYMIRSDMPYSLGTYAGAIVGDVGGNLKIRGGAIQSATGDIAVEVGQDLVLTAASGSLGTIRTTGERAQGSTGSQDYWDYQEGGDIRLRVGGDVQGALNNNAWDAVYTIPRKTQIRWSASYAGNNAAQGLITMAGGNLDVRTGGSLTAQAGTFGEGNLLLQAGGDLQGRFLVKEGLGRLSTLGSFGSSAFHQVIEAFDADISVTAGGDLNLATVLNPTIARPLNLNALVPWDLQYTADSAVSLATANGDVFLFGDSVFYHSYNNIEERILPPSLTIKAAGAIHLENQFALAPSSTGNLILSAAGNIDIGNRVYDRSTLPSLTMPDLDPARVYGFHQGFGALSLFSKSQHAEVPFHLSNGNPVTIVAGGDIKSLNVTLPKPAEITAGRDIIDLYYVGQNISADDVTSIQAGRNLRFSSSVGIPLDTGIQHGGPGWLAVRAGGAIDLGTSKGIQAVGNSANAALSSIGSSVLVSSGLMSSPSTSGVAPFFRTLREAGVNYSTLQSEGHLAEAQQFVTAFRDELSQNVFGAPSNSLPGDLNMVHSQISTVGEGSNLFLLVNGDLNVGKSTFFASEEQRRSTGIFTAAGGATNILARGDVNVNESRIMTFRGGDITVWSNLGDVNAGRGSKTAINVSAPTPTWENGALVIKFTPPAVGSGIRALTYDPDGPERPGTAPPEGDIYLFAPQGVIDAGEAGIAGGRVILGATQVLNASNISFSSGSVGLPSTSQGAVSLGTLTGLSSLAQEFKGDDAAGLPGAKNRLNQGESPKDQFAPSWLEVKVIGFDAEAEEEESKRN